MSDQNGSWQPDPFGRHEYRYWDGGQWTDQVSDGGVISSDAPTDHAPTATPADPTVPTAAAAPAQPSGAPAGSSSGSGNKTPMLVAGVVVLVALAAGAWFVLGGGDDDEEGREELVASFAAEEGTSREEAECLVDEMGGTIGMARMSEMEAQGDDATPSEEEMSAVFGAMAACGVDLFAPEDPAFDEDPSDADEALGDDTSDDTADDAAAEEAAGEGSDGNTSALGAGDIDLDDPVVEMFVQSMMEDVDLDEEQARCFAEQIMGFEELNFEDPSAEDGTDMMSAMFGLYEECDIDPLGMAGAGSGETTWGLLEGDTYGDNPELDVLWDACDDGDGDACGELYANSEIGSEYEEFGRTCGGRSESAMPMSC